MQDGFILMPPSEQLFHTVRIELRRLSYCVVVFVPSVALERQKVNVARLIPPTVPEVGETGMSFWIPSMSLDPDPVPQHCLLRSAVCESLPFWSFSATRSYLP